MGADHTPTVPLSATAFANRLRWYAHLLTNEERVLTAYAHEQDRAYIAGERAAFNRTHLANIAYVRLGEAGEALRALADELHPARRTSAGVVAVDPALVTDAQDRTPPHGDALA